MPTIKSPRFEAGPAQPVLHPGEVHLWRIALDPAPPGAGDSLSPAEWVRAERFHFKRDRTRFIAGRGLLRALLGRYLEIEPRELRFNIGLHGKPSLAGTCSSLRFNVSHSGDVILVAIAHAREIGVDVELMRDNVPFEMLAERYFEPEDAWSVRTLPAAARASKFYTVWTSTEARLKASGAGLSQGTKVIEPDRWSLLTLSPAEGYAAALAVEGGHYQLECWSWQN